MLNVLQQTERRIRQYKYYKQTFYNSANPKANLLFARSYFPPSLSSYNLQRYIRQNQTMSSLSFYPPIWWKEK